MALLSDLLEKPPVLSVASKYTVMNGVLYFGTGVLFIAWPGLVQTVFRDETFVGHEEALFRVVGLLLVVVGWLYVFGGRSGTPQAPAASVIDRLVFVPVVLLPLVLAGVFPHLFLALAILEPTLGIGAWILLSRKT
jgi:hypothetical protein